MDIPNGLTYHQFRSMVKGKYNQAQLSRAWTKYKQPTSKQPNKKSSKEITTLPTTQPTTQPTTLPVTIPTPTAPSTDTKHKQIRGKLAVALQQARQKKQPPITTQPITQPITQNSDQSTLQFWQENTPEGLTSAISRPEQHTWYTTQTGVTIIEPNTSNVRGLDDKTHSIRRALHNIGIELQNMTHETLPNDLIRIDLTIKPTKNAELAVWAIREELGLE